MLSTTGGRLVVFPNSFKRPPMAIARSIGVALAAAKIRRVWCVAGLWPSGGAVSDMNNTKTEFRNIMDTCPVPLVFMDVAGTPRLVGQNVMVA